MDQSRPYRPRISRETRLLLSTALIALMALWALARIRFPDQSAAATPVQPLLTQLGAKGSFQDLAAEIAQLRPRIEPLMVGAALRIRSDAALTLLHTPALPAHAISPEQVAGFDPASGLAVVRAPFLPAPPPVPWMPGDPEQPRYLVATDASTGALALQPVLVGSMVATSNPLWPDPIWLPPVGTGLVPGSFVFTTDALLAGLVIDLEGRTAIVPASVLLAEANRLLAAGGGVPGDFGFNVQALTPPVAKATGAASGVVVTWVDPDGPSAHSLAAGDVLEAVDGEALASPLQWRARAARIPAGGAVTIRVRRGDAVQDVALAAAPARPDPAVTMLGLTLRSVPGTGALVAEVESGSVAERAGLRTGDVITMAGDAKAPSPALVRRTYERAPAGTAILVGFVRSGTRAVTALEK
jgi:hypothetical protein